MYLSLLTSEAEFRAFERIYSSLPEIDAILNGATHLEFPTEPSARYAVTIGLAARGIGVQQVINAFKWLVDKAEVEWVHFYTMDALAKIRAEGQLGTLVGLVESEPRLKEFLSEINELTGA